MELTPGERRGCTAAALVVAAITISRETLTGVLLTLPSGNLPGRPAELITPLCRIPPGEVRARPGWPR